MIKAIIPVANARSHLMEVRLDMSIFDWPIGLNFKAQVANGPSETLLTLCLVMLWCYVEKARVYFECARK